MHKENNTQIKNIEEYKNSFPTANINMCKYRAN
jgi:hypothetical protein